METYLIIDIGTGNVRVAFVNTAGKIIWIDQDNVIYKKDDRYKEGLYFDPQYLWTQILGLIEKGLKAQPEMKIIAATVSSQREGIVLLDKAGKSLVGFPNHDHRGRFMEDMIEDKNTVYRLTGRYPSSLFSALKLVAYREKYPEEWKQVDCFLSISDWAQYQLSGKKVYEHAQASETLLYDVKNKKWSDKLLDVFGLQKSILPPLCFSGSKLGNIKQDHLKKWEITDDIPVFVGGADTQLAVKSTRPETGDVVLVSGTTTPVLNVTETYILDERQRSWTNSHLDKKQYILETNCGVTGLNYQRIKDIFYPKESYRTIEGELDEIQEARCFTNLGSLLANDKELITSGGFLFEVPIMTELSRADFAFATLWDIACSIKENFDCLLDIQFNENDYVWCSGGGFQSRHLRKYVAALLQKKLYLRPGYRQASVSGAVVVCEEALQLQANTDTDVEVIHPEEPDKYKVWYKKWKETRNKLKKLQNVKKSSRSSVEEEESCR